MKKSAINLGAINALHSPQRISSVDVFRAIAIISVVLCHFNEHLFPVGNLGVNLFFVISGLLVGGILIKTLKNDHPVNFFRFFLQRGFKIWPSYYFYILGASFIVFFYYKQPDQLIQVWDLKRYLLFYQNYTGFPLHIYFDQLWSLCVEEHFYILLPILFICVQKVIHHEHQAKALFICVLLTIAAGIIFKFCSFYFTNSKDTYSATHNRLDALAWGVLLSYILVYHPTLLKLFKVRVVAFLLGLVILFSSVYANFNFNNYFFYKTIYDSLIPASFFLLLAGAYHTNLTKLKLLRFMAYYSYNWYLWHGIIGLAIRQKLGTGILGLMLYLLGTFLFAVVVTILIEERALRQRKWVLQKIFPPKVEVAPIKLET